MKLTLRVKLLFTSLILVVPIFISFLLIYNNVNSNIEFSQLEITGLKTSAPLHDALFTLTEIQAGTKKNAELLEEYSRFTELAQIHAKELNFSPESLQKAGVPWTSTSSLENRAQFFLEGNQDTFASLYQFNTILLAYITDHSNLILDPDMNSYYLIKALLDEAVSVMSSVLKLQEYSVSNSSKMSLSETLQFYHSIELVISGVDQLVSALNQSILNEKAYFGSVPNFVPTMEKLKREIRQTGFSLQYYGEEAALKGNIASKELLSKILPLSKALKEFNSTGREFIEKILQLRINFYFNQLISDFSASLISTVLGIFVILWIVGRIRKRIFNQVWAFEKVAAGDLTVRMQDKGQDEISRSAAAFNQFMQRFELNFSNLRQLAVILKDSAQQVKDSSQVFTNASQIQTATVEETTESMDSFTGTFETIRGNMKNQVVETQTTFTKMDQLASGLESIRNDMRELLQSATQNSLSAQESEKTLQTSIEKSLALGTGIEKANEQMLSIRAGTVHIDDLLKAISQISGNTSLLAMNAAIEAAHAGESGKGFSVVSEEIRKLSSDTQVFVDDISRIMEQIRDAVATGSEITHQGALDAEEMSQISESSRSAIREINSGFFDIQQKIQSILTFIEENETVARHVEERSQSLNHETASLSTSVETQSIDAQQIANQIQTLSKTAIETSQNGETLQKLSETLSQQALQLQKNMLLFKVSS